MVLDQINLEIYVLERRRRKNQRMTQVKMFIHLCHPLVLSSPTLMMHGHMNLKY